MEKAAKLVRDTAGADGSVPCIFGGDFNSLPISSVLSAFYNENIETKDEETLFTNPSIWQLENPPFVNTNSNQIPQEKQWSPSRTPNKKTIYIYRTSVLYYTVLCNCKG